VGVIPFNLGGTNHYEVASVLSFEGGIGVRNGCFCAHPYILRLLRVSSEEALRHQQEIIAGTKVGLPGLVRISFGCYNTVEEVDHAVDVLGRIAVGEIEGEYEQDPGSGEYWPRNYEPDYTEFFSFQPMVKYPDRKMAIPGCGM
jgi:hypothetical protein